MELLETVVAQFLHFFEGSPHQQIFILTENMFWVSFLIKTENRRIHEITFPQIKKTRTIHEN